MNLRIMSVTMELNLTGTFQRLIKSITVSVLLVSVLNIVTFMIINGRKKMEIYARDIKK